MQLYLIRHAIAVDSTASAPTVDGERALTEVGAKKMRKQAGALQQMGVAFDVVLTSPLIRARQTAEIVCDVLGCLDRVKRCDALAPGCVIEEIVDALRPYESMSSVALVGHNPDFEELASVLIGARTDAAIQFKKGGICRIDISQFDPHPSGELIWHLTPRLLRMISN